MLIHIPSWAVRLWDRFCDFGGVVLYTGRIQILVADVLTVVFVISTGSYYLITSGWQAALQTAALGIFGYAAVFLLMPAGDRQQ